MRRLKNFDFVAVDDLRKCCSYCSMRIFSLISKKCFGGPSDHHTNKHYLLPGTVVPQTQISDLLPLSGAY